MNFECRIPKALTSLFNIRYWTFDIKILNLITRPYQVEFYPAFAVKSYIFKRAIQ
jgi:hypothetical protein